VSTLRESLRNARFFDLSPRIDTDFPCFPGHPPVVVDHDARTHHRDGYFVQALAFGEHTGSHVDAPAHIHAQLCDQTIDSFPVDSFIAPYVKYDLTPLGLRAGENASEAQLAAIEERDGFAPVEGEIALIEFGWDRFLQAGDERVSDPSYWAANTPGLGEDACRRLAGAGVRGVGSDTPTCDTSVLDGVIQTDFGHARWFLPRGILTFEGLVGLSAIPTRGFFIGRPLKIAGGSGSPIRAVAIAEG
jgi:kynurenine formamidase